MASGGGADYSQQAIFLPHISRAISLHNAQTVLLLSLQSVHHILAHCSGSHCRQATKLDSEQPPLVFAPWNGNSDERACRCLQPARMTRQQTGVWMSSPSCTVFQQAGLYMTSACSAQWRERQVFGHLTLLPRASTVWHGDMVIGRSLDVP